MTDTCLIARLAAKGDGVTSDGRHVVLSVPGDSIEPSGAVVRGPHHVDPPCRHFTKCGGCQLQHADETVLADFVRDRVVNAAKGQGMEVGELEPVYLSPPHSRRRAIMHGLRVHGGAVIGFREGGSHRIVDLRECWVLQRDLFALVQPLRQFIAAHGPRANVDVTLAMCDQGIDLGLSNFPLDGLAATEAALEFAEIHALARLSIDQGYGAETVWEPNPVSVTLSGNVTSFPSGAFLQATRDAEERMVADAQEWLKDSRMVADLFAGLGTFAFGLVKTMGPGGKVLAVEADQPAYFACKGTAARLGGTVHTLHRDLFRAPLQPAELNRFDAVLLDPPRAGAKSQITEIAASKLQRVVYVSCNPSSWARDGAALTEAGFRLTRLRPVGQFRWSSHVELISLFEREG